MADFTLSAAPTLGGFDQTFGSTRLREEPSLTLVSLAIPNGSEADVADAVKAAWNMDLPTPRLASRSADGRRRMIQIAADQLMAIFPGTAPCADKAVRESLRDTVYTTDQTDSWVVLSLNGPGAMRALARICPLDLDLDVFPEGAYGRTVMEHLGALILRVDRDSFLFLSASSSAKSFLHAVVTSLENTR